MSDLEKPKHYTSGGIECWDYMEAVMSPEEFRGYLWGNCIKYNHRWQYKGGLEDLKKLQVYAKKLEEHERKDIE